MKYLIAISLLLFSTLSTAGVVSGAVGGAVGGLIVASANKPTIVKPKEDKIQMPIGSSLLVCKITSDGTCGWNYSKEFPPARFAKIKGFSRIHSQTYEKCSDSYTGYCVVMVVSK